MQLNDDASAAPPMRASTQDGTYPRPQLIRPQWTDLSGPWAYRNDDADAGLALGWHKGFDSDLKITVPYPPESPSSGIHDTGFHSVIWYSRQITREEIGRSGLGCGFANRLFVRFGAVDYRSKVWLNGVFLGEHEGGHTPFSFDVTEAIHDGASPQTLVVRAEDDPHDVTQPRGKQDWQLEPHVIWYHRTSGIWQPVWLESVPAVAVENIRWGSDLPGASVSAMVRLTAAPAPGSRVRIVLSYDGTRLGETEVPVTRCETEVVIHLPAQANGQNYEHLLWSPEHPRLIDATVTLEASSSQDAVYSYLGLRSVDVTRGRFLLNDRPYYIRSVLNQGYWPESHLASPSADALRTEAQLIKDLGFNATRVHQKIEDPRFLFWADKLGLLVWEEMPSVFEFSTDAVRRVVAEWEEVVRRDVSHPCIVTWVPLNESWGVQHIAHSEQVQQFARALVSLTKALDPTRPVVSNDGWEHLDSDIWSIHDYEGSGEVLAQRYADAEAIARLFLGIGPAGRPLRLSDEPDRGQPVMLTEFGGVKYEVGASMGDAWGYTSATSESDFSARFEAVVSAVHRSTALAGFCYTQLADTLQEANGLVTESRVPKLPIEHIRQIVQGSHPGP